MTGLIALVAALVVGTAAGLVWRRANGRMRAPAGSRAPASAVPVPAVVVPVPVGSDEPEVSMAGEVGGPRLGPDELGQALGERATLVQFSSAFCAPCRATRRVLTDVASMVDGVSHVEIDAESRLDLVRAHGVLRTPTVLVLAADGRIVRRASGQPRKADVIAAVGLAVTAETGGGESRSLSRPAGAESS